MANGNGNGDVMLKKLQPWIFALVMMAGGAFGGATVAKSGPEQTLSHEGEKADVRHDEQIRALDARVTTLEKTMGEKIDRNTRATETVAARVEKLIDEQREWQVGVTNALKERDK